MAHKAPYAMALPYHLHRRHPAGYFNSSNQLSDLKIIESTETVIIRLYSRRNIGQAKSANLGIPSPKIEN